MSELFALSFDGIAISFLSCLVLREIIMATIPSKGFRLGA